MGSPRGPGGPPYNIMKRFFLLAFFCAGLAPAADLFRDDFSHFPPGWLTSPVGSLNGAIQEYHYLPNRGVPLGPWENADLPPRLPGW